VDLFRGNLSTIPPFHLSTFKDPVDPVIHVLFRRVEKAPEPFGPGAWL